jgi:formylglycine-generating enzyme required for sulfatase activity
MNVDNAIKVFISYSHDSDEHKQQVLELANSLRRDGIDCILDLYVQAPPEGWQRWMQHQLEQSRFVLLICTETYCHRFKGLEAHGRGKGVTWEGQIISQILYDKNTETDRFIPVVPDGVDEDAIPYPLRSYTIHKYPSGYSNLYRQLTGQPEVLIPPIGLIKPMRPLDVVSEGAPQLVRTSSTATVPHTIAITTYNYDVFLLYSKEDTLAVEELAQRLCKEGINARIGCSPDIGQPLEEPVKRELLQSKTCAVFFGPNGGASWRNEEMRDSLWRRLDNYKSDFKVIPVLLPRAERPSRSRLPIFLASSTWIEFRFTLSDDAAFRQLWSEIVGIEPGNVAGLGPMDNPYRGLHAFGVGDDRFFFGREAQTQWLIEKMRTSFAPKQETKFLAILGPSGSGKSSLARAGLISGLKRGEIAGSSEWFYCIFRPGSDPLESLAIALSDATNTMQDIARLRSLIDELGKDHRTLHLNTRYTLRQYQERLLFIFVDQFEEVFTLCNKEEIREAFFKNLYYAANSAEGQVFIVITMRTDFYGKCAAYQTLATMLSDRQMLINPMSRNELRSAIERPAQLAGCEFEAGLVGTLLDAAEGEPGTLPLLQHTLLELWKNKQNLKLTHEAYESIGRLEGALENRAEVVFGSFNEHEKELCRRIMLRLIQPGDGTEDTKRRTPLRELLASKNERIEVERIISVLASRDARLITTNINIDSPSEAIVEISHEALIHGWARLRRWIDENRESLRTQRQLTSAAVEWSANECNESFLYSGARLVRALEWSLLHQDEVNDDEREFLKRSQDRDASARRLSDSATLDQLETSAKKLWLNLSEMRVWLRRARALTSTLPDHRRQIEALQLESSGKPNLGVEVESDVPDSNVNHRYETLKVFIQRLELFSRGLLAAAEHVVGIKSDVQKHTIEAASTEWREVIDSIADIKISPQYGGLKIKPQLGLVPLGPDPDSGLWEFAHLLTGSAPERSSNGKISKTEEMGIVLVLIPGGQFRMGAVLPTELSPLGHPNVDPYAREEESPIHDVTLDPFFISKYQMTQGQWLRATGTNLSYWKTKVAEETEEISLLHPIECVSWYESSQTLKEIELILPTEAQWEYAARSGTTTIWWTGDDPHILDGRANLLGCREKVYSMVSPTIVGLFESPNAFGLYDVAGNVWEWCRDWYGSYQSRVREKDAERHIENGKTYVCRGGSFFNTVEYGRSSIRYFHVPPDARFTNLGLRPARVLDD